MNKPSNEYLSAFVDGELSRKEVDAMFKALGEDKQLADSACELRTLKLMVRHAYEDTLNHKPSKPALLGGNLPKAIAAALILGFGSLVGWNLHDVAQPQARNIAAWKPTGNLQPVSLASAMEDSSRILLHIDNNDPEQIRYALDEASALLKNGLAQKKNVHIEILANNRGLDMLRSDRSKVVTQIDRLSQEYPRNVSFVACGQSIKRFEQEGQTIRLLPQVQVAPTAIGEIVHHLKAGWTYIKV